MRDSTKQKASHLMTKLSAPALKWLSQVVLETKIILLLQSLQVKFIPLIQLKLNQLPNVTKSPHHLAHPQQRSLALNHSRTSRQKCGSLANAVGQLVGTTAGSSQCYKSLILINIESRVFKNYGKPGLHDGSRSSSELLRMAAHPSHASIS